MLKTLLLAGLFVLALALVGATCQSAVQQASDDAARQAQQEAERLAQEAANEARAQAEAAVQRESENLLQRATRWLDDGVAYVCRLAVLPGDRCRDPVDWLYNEPSLAALDYGYTAKDLTELGLLGSSVTPGGLALNTAMAYPDFSQCVRPRRDYGIKPCGRTALTAVGLAAGVALLLGAPLAPAIVVIGGAAALKFLLFDRPGL